MVKVSQEMKVVLEKLRTIPMATADASGKPNVILVGMWWWEDDETLVVVDNFLNKTMRNLKANPRGAFVGWDRDARKSFQFKGRVEVQREGPLYEMGHEKATNRERPLPGRAVVVVKVEEVYQARGGQGAGERVL
jgi:predicted pyridoxine 5'-phosphate oxidase superfamily flavin-nucleotide-binding protein